MEFYEVIKSRKTTRDLQDKPIPEDILERILRAGINAPANARARTWEFVVIKDAKEKAKVLSKIDKNVSDEEIIRFLDEKQMIDAMQRKTFMNSVPKQYSMLFSSGCLILPLFKQDWVLLKPEKINDLNNFASAWCCIENMLLAATAEGLGITLRIPFPEEVPHIKQMIAYPDNYCMPCYIAIGYPMENAETYVKDDYNLSDLIHINKWSK